MFARILLITIGSLLGLSWAELQAAVIHVGEGRPLKTIRKGLEVALEGDTVIVDAGIYQEGNIEIRRSVVLMGRQGAVMDGGKKVEILSIFASKTRVEGFTIRRSGKSSIRDLAALKVYDAREVGIINNRFEDNFFAIYLSNAQQCVIKGNTLFSYGESELLTANGIHAWKSDSLTIQDNHIEGHRDGIYLEFVTHTAVERNTVVGNHRYGLHFMFSHDNGYFHNRFIRNGAGVAVMYTSGVRMEHNLFGESWGDAAYGLLLKDIRDSHIENNIFRSNTTGILMEGSNRVTMKHNHFESNGWAMKIQSSCMDNLLTHNNFIQNSFDLATNGSLKTNRFEFNYWDKYEGYDLDKDEIGDIPFRPVSLYSMIVERYPAAMLLFHSFMVSLLDRTEQVLPSLVPEDLQDTSPLMNPVPL